MGIRTFEDLTAWQKARLLVGAVYQATGGVAFDRDRDLRSQLRRAAVSVLANIAEGFERGTQKDFAHFLTMARASCGEVRSHLYVCEDVGHLSPESAQQLRDQAAEVSRIIYGLRAKVSDK